MRPKIQLLIKHYISHQKKILCFGIVGMGGVITNMTVFLLAIYFFNLSILLAATFAFAVAVTQNYILNHTWTFQMGSLKSHNRNDYVRYVTVNILGLSINLAILHLLVQVGLNPAIAQLCGIAGAMATNYVGSYLFVFRIR